MISPSLVLEYWHPGLAGIAVLFSLRDQQNFGVALIYFCVLAAFYGAGIAYNMTTGQGMADIYGGNYYIICAVVELSIFASLIGYPGRLAKYIRHTSVAAATIQLSVFAAYHFPALKWAYDVYWLPLVIIEVGQCLAIIGLSSPVISLLARRNRAKRSKGEATWTAKTLNG